MYFIYILGGFEGVVWSDFIQGVILLGGALLIIIIGAFEIKGGFGTIVHEAIANKKFLAQIIGNLTQQQRRSQLFSWEIFLIIYINIQRAKM